MTVALSSSLPSDLIKNLIVADIAPSRGRLSPDFEMYLQAMHKIEDSKLKTRKEADHMLHEFVKVHSRSELSISPCTICATSSYSSIDDII